MSADRVPYVGRLTRRSGHVYTATGYSKWGMTAGTVAAGLITDAILGRASPWADLYDAKRLNLRASGGKLLKENAATGLRFVAQRVSRADKRRPEELAEGEGAVMRSAASSERSTRTSRASSTCSRRCAATCGATWSGTRPSARGTAPATARATTQRAERFRARPCRI